MANHLDNSAARRRFLAITTTLIVLAVAMIWSTDAGASRGCTNCKAKASRAKLKYSRGKRPVNRVKAAKATSTSASTSTSAVSTSTSGTTAPTAIPVSTTTTSTTVSTTTTSPAPAPAPTEVEVPPAPVAEEVAPLPSPLPPATTETPQAEVQPGPPHVEAGGSTSTSCGSGGSASVSVGMGSYSAMARPGSCWRPYASNSPFNTALAANAPALSGSQAQISRLLAGSPISYFVAGDPDRDFGTAVYYPKASDPTYTIHCTEPWGRCAIEGAVVHLPQGAAPSGPWPIGNGDADSHLTIVDQESGWEYDLWNVREIGNGKIITRWGGKTQIAGNGLGSDAVAAQFGGMAGLITPEEMKAGQINHALALTIPCTQGFVAPATKGGLECSDAGMSTQGALPMGAHLQLRMSTSEIEAMNAPAWKKGILRAFATYGAYVEDTTGAESQWCLKFESPNGSTSQGGSDGYVDLAKSLGMHPEDYNGNGYPEYWFNVAGGVDWNKLQVVS